MQRIRSRNRFYNKNNTSEIVQICPSNQIQKKYVFKSISKCKDNAHATLCLNASKVSNQGVFVNKNIKQCNVIGIGIENIKKYFGLNYRITNLGRKINHCHKHANIYLEKDKSKNNYLIVALKDINKNDELFLNYKYLPYYIYDASWYFKDC